MAEYQLIISGVHYGAHIHKEAINIISVHVKLHLSIGMI